MVANWNKAFDIGDDGLVIDGVVFLAGSADPSASTGIPCPIGSLYVQAITAGQQLWYKYGSGDTEWRKLRAQDLGAAAMFTARFGRSGTVTPSTWLQSETVPSNQVGEPIPFDNATICTIAVFNELSTSYKVTIYEHDGTTYTSLYSVSVAAGKGSVTQALSVAVTKGKMVAAQVASDSANSVKNPRVTVIVRGDA